MLQIPLKKISGLFLFLVCFACFVFGFVFCQNFFFFNIYLILGLQKEIKGVRKRYPKGLWRESLVGATGRRYSLTAVESSQFKERPYQTTKRNKKRKQRHRHKYKYYHKHKHKKWGRGRQYSGARHRKTNSSIQQRTPPKPNSSLNQHPNTAKQTPVTITFFFSSSCASFSSFHFFSFYWPG